MSRRDQPYDVIIGLEVHVQLLTASKLFCGCSTRFGEPPNTQTCPVCIGMPGTLPVMNRRAYELSVKAALAVNCTVARFTKWDRKQYYYPDLPKNYQISQFDLPLSHDGYLLIGDPEGGIKPKRIGIIRAHLEEDAGKSMHDEAAGKADSRIDLNRTGTPLLEIVSEPDLRSPAEAKAYLTELKLLLNYLGVSDCNMQEGSLRVDANINLHCDTPEGKVPTPIVEVKNMNSFRAVERALAYEAQRQYEVFQETGQRLGEVPKQTRGWDESAQVTRPQRSKEESSDYRYFPDPDLVPVTMTDEAIRAIRGSLGELPAQLRSRHPPLRQRRAGEPGPTAGRLLRRAGRHLRRRQAGQQLDPARRAPHAQRAADRHRRVSRRRAVVGRTAPEGRRRRARYRPRPGGPGRDGRLGHLGRRGHEGPGDRGGRRLGPRNALPGALGRESQDRRRREARQAQGRRVADRPGQEEEPQREPGAGSGDLHSVDSGGGMTNDQCPMSN